jgi:deoxynucleotide monophosphate kinase-like protein
MNRIISFSGRKGSGKTELTKLLSEYGYEEINFADSLKLLVCKIVKCDLKTLNNIKDVKFSYELSQENLKIISATTGVPISDCERTLNGKIFKSIRQLLQEIGTEVIRSYNPGWHVKKVREILYSNPNKKYCIGDTRFKDEKKLIENFHGECWFIIRPYGYTDISNHQSEIDLLWPDFDNIFINDCTNKKSLIEKFESHVVKMNSAAIPTNSGFNGSNAELRDKLMKYKGKINDDLKKYLNIQDKEEISVNKEVFLMSDYSYILDGLHSISVIMSDDYELYLEVIPKQKHFIDLLKSVLYLTCTNKILSRKKKSRYYLKYCNPYVIENLKLWGGFNIYY